MTTSKYKAKQTIIGNRKFPSQKEAKRYVELMRMWEAGEILYFLPQVPLELDKDGSARYRVDFQVHWPDKTVTYEDVKGMKTDMYKLKKKLIEARYKIKIQEI